MDLGRGRRWGVGGSGQGQGGPGAARVVAGTGGWGALALGGVQRGARGSAPLRPLGIPARGEGTPRGWRGAGQDCPTSAASPPAFPAAGLACQLESDLGLGIRVSFDLHETPFENSCPSAQAQGREEKGFCLCLHVGKKEEKGGGFLGTGTGPVWRAPPAPSNQTWGFPLCPFTSR